MKLYCLIIIVCLTTACSSKKDKFDLLQQSFDKALNQNDSLAQSILNDQLSIAKTKEDSIKIKLNQFELYALQEKTDACFRIITELEALNLKDTRFYGQLLLNKANVNGLIFNTDSCLFYFNQAKSWFIQRNDTSSFVTININTAYTLLNQEKTLEASQVLHSLVQLELFNHLEPRLQGGIFAGLGELYYMISDYDQSYDFFSKALEQFSICGYQRGISSVLNGLGILCLEHNKFDQAEDYLKKAIETSYKANDSLKTIMAILNLGNVFQKTQKPDSALLYYSKAYTYCVRKNDLEGIPLSALNLASILVEKPDQRHEAFLLLTKAIELDQSFNRTYSLAYDYAGLSTYYGHIGDYTSAIKTNQKAILKADSMNILTLLLEAYQNQSDWYKKLNNDTKALEFLEKKVSVQQLINNQEIQDKIAREELLREIKSANKKSNVLQTEFHALHKKSNDKTAYIFILLFGLLLGITALYYKVKKNKKLQKDLQNQENKIALQTTEIEHSHQNVEALKTTVAQKSQLFESIQKNDKVLARMTQELKKEHDWVHFLAEFELIYPGFLDKIKKTYPQMTNQDVRMCCLLKLRLSQKEISDILSVSIDAVKKAKQRLKNRTSQEFLDTL